MSASRMGKNNLKNSIIKKIRSEGLEVIPFIYRDGLSNDEALSLERSLIAKYGRRDLKEGILSNLTDGGDGAWRTKISDETRQKMRDRMTGAGSPTYGVGHTKEAREKMSLGQKARVAKGLITRHSDEHKQRLRENNKGGLATRKQAVKLTLGGQIVETYESLTSLATELGMAKGACLAYVVKDGSIPRDGFFYRYTGSLDITSSGIANAETLIKKRARADRNAVSAKPVVKISPEGIVIAIYESAKEAGRQNPHLKYHNISKAIQHNRPHDGFYWRKEVDG